MQHKRNSSAKGIILGLLAVIVIGGGIFLMASPIPAPQQPIEKELDADSLLSSKPAQ